MVISRRIADKVMSSAICVVTMLVLIMVMNMSAWITYASKYDNDD